MASSSTSNSKPMAEQGFQEVLGRGKRTKNVERMNALIQAEGEDDDQPSASRRHPRSRRIRKNKTVAVNSSNFFSDLPVEEVSDADDNDFITSESSSQSSSSGSDNDIREISNAELADVLPMKTVPSRGGNTDPDAHHLRKKPSTKSKRKATGYSLAANGPQLSKRARVEEAEDEDTMHSQPSLSQIPAAKLFFSRVDQQIPSTSSMKRY
ncbi:hypothetical protein M405DRAFT_868725 [Rhizopogon salebrosus TDB-379]|nr:hypothetical protein M405DRAFT_868725 [Rhizopogon salebrosus TDB-379]